MTKPSKRAVCVARGAINLFAGTNIDIDEKEEAIDMCKEVCKEKK